MYYGGEILALASAIFFGLNAVFMRWGLNRGDPQTGIVITLLVNNTLNLVLVVVWLILGLLPSLNLQGVFYFALGGFFTSNLGRYFQTIGMGYIGTSRTSAFKVSAPIFTILVSLIFFGEKVSLTALGGMVIVLAGLLAVTFTMENSGQKVGNESLGEKGAVEARLVAGKEKPAKIGLPDAVKKGAFFGILAGLAFALGQIFRKMGMEIVPSFVVGASLGSFVALCCFLVIVFRGTGLTGFNERVRTNYNAGFVLSGIFSSLAIYSFFLSLLYTTLAKANVLVNTEILATLLMGHLVLGKTEGVNRKLVWAAITVFAGVVLIILY